MAQDDFVFTIGNWLGEGKITFSASHEFIKFYTKWQVKAEKQGVMKATHIVEMQGIEEHVINQLTFLDIQEKKFTVILENQMVGKIQGTGLRDNNVIAWEFRQPHFEGFEVYELQENGDYFFHAEYGSPDQFRTLVEGLIWRKS
jgi:hypothetical protein